MPERWFTWSTLVFAWNWTALWMSATEAEFHAHVARHELLGELMTVFAAVSSPRIEE